MEYSYNLTEQQYILEENASLRSRCVILEQENALLKKTADAMRDSLNTLQTIVADNMKNYVKPALEYLGTRVSPEERRVFTALIEESVYPITQQRNARLTILSPREIQVATLIKEGQSSKQIADTLFISKKAVDYHRASIRKKLILESGKNLQAYLKAYL